MNSGTGRPNSGAHRPTSSIAVLALVALLVCGGSTAVADEFRPAFLQLTRVGPESWDVSWKVPALDEATTLALRPVFPEGTEVLTPPRIRYAEQAAVQTWRVRLAGGLEGREIGFPGLAKTRIDVLVRIVGADGAERLGRVSPLDPRVVVAAAPGRIEIARTYALLGVGHILGSFDHLLFVLSLCLLVSGTRRLLATITAFTLAHSITLALATLGVLRLPGPPVEATIALSIIFVAVELVRDREGRPGLAASRPWIVAFAFGLLHGLGFAGALAEVGLPPNAIPTALLFFNLGVEVGQVLFVAVVLAALATADRLARWFGFDWPRWLPGLVPYAIGGLASFWLFERLAAFAAS